MNNFKTFLQRHKYAVCIFIFAVLYGLLFASNGKLWHVSEATYAFHAVDYSVGFCSRLLPGAISNFLFHPISHTKVNLFETALILFVFAAASFFLEKLYLAADPALHPSLKLIIFLYITGSFTFSVYIKAFGLLDVYWVYLTVIILFLLKNKHLYFLIPFFGASMVLIHYSVMLCFVPFIAILLLYKASVCGEKKERRYIIAVACLTICACTVLSGYFLCFEKYNLRMTMQQFDAEMESRGVGDTAYFDEALFSYYDRSFDSDEPSQENTSSDWSDYSFFELIAKRISATATEERKKGVPWSVIASFLLLAPLLYFGIKTLYKLLPTLADRLSRFSVFCASALFFGVLIGGFLFSLDRIRWISHAFFLSFTLYLYILYHSKELQKIILSNIDSNKIPFPLIIAYCLVYSATLFHPYS